MVVPQKEWRPLLEQQDARLQSLLSHRLRSNAQWRKLIDTRKLAVGVVDLSEPTRPRFAGINHRVAMYAASLPKVAILLAVFDHFERGLLTRTPKIDRDLEAMIRVSDNRAATRMIDRLGGLSAVNEVLADPRYGFYDPQGSGGLWVGKRYAKRGPRLPDPVKGISHAATAAQTCRLYYQLATGRLISPQASRDMLALLENPGIEHKFVKVLRQRAPRARLYRKSGTWKHWHADSVLVWGPEWRRYILVAMTESPRGEQILRELVVEVEAVLQAEGSSRD
jgi:beta-lactamase class A